MLTTLSNDGAFLKVICSFTLQQAIAAHLTKGSIMRQHLPELSTASFPIFFDPSGKRWRRVLELCGLILLLLAGLIVWFTPGALAPVWASERNHSSAYIHELLETGDVENIPLLGEETGFTFSRIALIRHVNDRVYLADPFSDTVFRQATEEEVVEIGSHPYVVEQFGKPAERQLMLTFDDGPHPQYTPQILDILSREGVPATFFGLGENMVKYPDLLQRIIREGHMVANHTMTHIDFDANSDLVNREELIGTDRVIRSIGNYETRLFRIPGGDPDNNPLALLQSQQLGYLHINMDIDTLDWSYDPSEAVPVPSLDGEGHVVLLHDSGGDRSATIAMLEELIAQAKAMDYTFTTVEPILPPEYVPVRNITPAIADHATVAALFTFVAAPSVLIGWLFWFGIGSLTIMSLIYVVLALVTHHKERRRYWGECDESALPLVSVLLPVFNEAMVIEKTLAALRASDYPAMEVIAIDDGSTDETLAIMQRFARDWPQLRVLHQANAGKSAASNYGIAVAKGDVVVTLDGDTLFEPHTIRMLARHFIDEDAKKRVGAVAGHVKVGNRRNILTAWQSLEYISGICVTRMAEGAIDAISIVPGACAAWRKEALVQAGGYSHDTMAEDADLTLSIQRLGYRIVQENSAVAWTEAPMTIVGLAKQRLRWTYGNLQALRKHRAMILRPQYGLLGMVALPYALLSLVIPLLFMPLTIVVAVVSLTDGNWQSIVAFAIFVAVIHLVISIIAVAMVREKAWHLLIVPIYRLIYEPLRAYLLYAALIRAIKGRVVGWYRPERTNSVIAPSVT